MNDNILVLAPHTDDGELGCGGSIAKYIEEGKSVFYVAFSACEKSIPDGYPLDILKKELNMAMKSLGIPTKNIFVLNYPVRCFCEYRQDILDEMIHLNSLLHPTIVFSPSPRDIHQDHSVIAKEAMRAFKKTTLLGYEVPWNNFEFRNQAYIRLEKRHIETKVEAIACYASQKDRAYTSKDFTYGQARMHGVQIDALYAEVFEVIRLIC